MFLPQSNLPPPVPPAVPQSGTPAETDHRRQRRLQYMTDAGIALLLLLTLGIVFVTDRHSPAKDALYARNASSARFLFDPLRVPIAEVRQNPKRQEWIGAYGGTPQSEAAVRRGLDWLARHQMPDGHWGPDALRCLSRWPLQGRRRLPRRRQRTPRGIDRAGRAGLPGRRALRFQRSRVLQLRPPWTGLAGGPSTARRLFARSRAWRRACNMYEHGIATFALADACEMAASLQCEPLDRYRQATQRAVQFIHYAQHNDGGCVTRVAHPPSLNGA